MSALVYCRACASPHERGSLYGCTGCDRVLCAAQVRPEGLFHYIETSRGRAACGRIERLELTNDLRRPRPVDAIRRGA